MFHNFLQKRDSEIFSQFRKVRNKANSDLRKANSDFYQGKFFNVRGDHQNLCDNVNDLLNRKQQHGSVQEININSRHVTGEKLAETMNRHFISAGKYNGQIHSPDYPIDYNKLQDSIILSPAAFVEIDSVIDSLDNDAAAGYDGIKSPTLKYTSHIISPVLTHIINRMVETGDFPDELKIAKVTPVYKGGGEADINNYRPFSVLPILSKIVERITNDRLCHFFAKHQIISQSQ